MTTNKTQAAEKPESETLNATRMTMDSLDRQITFNEKKLRSSMENLRDRLNDAERALNDGRMPNTCGIVQGLGSEIDGLVVALDTAKTIRANFRAAAEFDKNHAPAETPAVKTARLCGECFARKTTKEIEGADAFAKHDTYHLVAKDGDAICGVEAR